MSMRRVVGAAILPLLLMAASACSGDAEMTGNAGASAGPDAPSDPAELAEDAALANEAAADEAADIEAYGGNAAAMEANRR